MTHRFRSGFGFLTLALSALLVAPSLVSAQDTFSISGRTISLEGEALQYTVVGVPELKSWALSDEDGFFELTGIKAGEYRFAAIKRGYYYADAYVTFNGAAQLDVQLEIEDPDNRVALGSLSGTVFDQESGNTIRDAEMRLEPMNITEETGRRGQFEFTGLTVGALRLTTTRLGYKTRVDTLAALPDVSLNIRIHLQPEALQLDPLEVTVQIRNRYLERQGFYRRQQRGQGTQWDQAEIMEQVQRRNAVYLTQLFDMVPGVRRGQGQFGEVALVSTRDGCTLTPVVNGMRTPGFDLDAYPPEAVTAVEIYRGAQVPAEYHDPCGVVMIWTR